MPKPDRSALDRAALAMLEEESPGPQPRKLPEALTDEEEFEALRPLPKRTDEEEFEACSRALPSAEARLEKLKAGLRAAEADGNLRLAGTLSMQLESVERQVEAARDRLEAVVARRAQRLRSRPA